MENSRYSLTWDYFFSNLPFSLYFSLMYFLFQTLSSTIRKQMSSQGGKKFLEVSGKKIVSHIIPHLLLNCIHFPIWWTPAGNLFEFEWKGRILPFQWNSVTVLHWRFVFSVPSLKGLSMQFFSNMRNSSGSSLRVLFSGFLIAHPVRASK